MKDSITIFISVFITSLLIIAFYLDTSKKLDLILAKQNIQNIKELGNVEITSFNENVKGWQKGGVNMESIENIVRFSNVLKMVDDWHKLTLTIPEIENKKDEEEFEIEILEQCCAEYLEVKQC